MPVSGDRTWYLDDWENPSGDPNVRNEIFSKEVFCLDCFLVQLKIGIKNYCNYYLKLYLLHECENRYLDSIPCLLYAYDRLLVSR